MSELGPLRKALDGLAFAAHQQGEVKQSALGDCADVAEWIAQAMAHAEAYAAAERAAERERCAIIAESATKEQRASIAHLCPGGVCECRIALAIRDPAAAGMCPPAAAAAACGAKPEAPQHTAPSGRLKER